jgi:hypothetical protein
MPSLHREVAIGPFMVKWRTRLPNEAYSTDHAIQTFYRGHLFHEIFDSFAYGDDVEYMERKWSSIVENVQREVEIDAVT